MKTPNYEEDIKIDESALDVEWVEQADLAIKYSKYYLWKRKEQQLIHEKVKTKRSELIREANEDPMKCCGKAKTNAGDLEAYYRTHVDYKETKEEFIEAEYEANLAEIMKNEIAYTRKKALENLVVLHGQQYFAGPSVPRNLNEIMNERRIVKPADKALKSMKRKKKK